MSSDRITTTVPGDGLVGVADPNPAQVDAVVPSDAMVTARAAGSTQVGAIVRGSASVTVALRNMFQPIILLVDGDGNAIEDAAAPGTYWAITVEDYEASL